MNKNKLFYTITEVMARQSRGAYWVSFIQTYFDPTKIILYSGMIKILYPQIPNIVLFTGSGIILFSIEIIKYFIGRYDERKGFWRKQNEYNQKKDHLAPFNMELKETLKEICKKLEIKDSFKDL